MLPQVTSCIVQSQRHLLHCINVELGGYLELGFVVGRHTAYFQTDCLAVVLRFQSWKGCSHFVWFLAVEAALALVRSTDRFLHAILRSRIRKLWHRK